MANANPDLSKLKDAAGAAAAKVRERQRSRRGPGGWDHSFARGRLGENGRPQRAWRVLCMRTPSTGAIPACWRAARLCV